MIDEKSETWRTISEYIEEQYRELADVLTDPLINHDQTQYARGQVVALEQLVKLCTQDNSPRIGVAKYF